MVVLPIVVPLVFLFAAVVVVVAQQLVSEQLLILRSAAEAVATQWQQVLYHRRGKQQGLPKIGTFSSHAVAACFQQSANQLHRKKRQG